MMHPLLRLVATKPQLLADHAQAYAGLVTDEISRAVAGVKKRVVLSAIAFALLGLAVVFGGVAVMLWASLPLSAMPAPWALLAVPGVPTLAGVVCLLLGRGEPEAAFAELKQQVATDMNLLREVGAAS